MVATLKSLGVALSLGASLSILIACSQSTAHPDPIGDCKSAYGCNPVLGAAGGSGGTTPTSDGGPREASAADARAEAAADSGVSDAPAE